MGAALVVASPSVLALRPPREVRALGLPWDSPVVVYLTTLASSSRATQIVALRNCARALGFTLADCPWHRLKVAQMGALRGFLAETFAPATANRHLGAVREVLRAAARLELMSRERTLALCDFHPVKGSRVRPGRMVEPDELSLVLLGGDGSAFDRRAVAAVALCYGSGLRRAEATSLVLERLDLTRRLLVVVGKGNKERRVPIPKKALVQLRAWLELRGEEQGGPFLCRLDRWGGIHPREAVQPQHVRDWCARLCALRGVAHFTPHDLRRTFISNLLGLADLITVQGLVGHTDPATTAVYDYRPELLGFAAVEQLTYPGPD